MTLHGPRAAFERFAYLCFLTLVIGSLAQTWLGLLNGFHSGDLWPALGGVGAMAFAALVRQYGYRHLHFRECEESFELAETHLEEDSEHASRRRALHALLQELTLLERRRDTGEVDIWVIQEVRDRATMLLEHDPALGKDLAFELESHPEVRPR